MPDIEQLARQLADELKKQKADFVEARLEESESSQIIYRGRVLESIGRNTGAGGNIRALRKGGWGFTSFNSFDDIASRVPLAVEQAAAVGTGKSELAQVDPVQDNVSAGVQQNPVEIPLSDKKAILDEYNEIIWSTPQLQTSTIGYSDGRKKVVYVNSEGAFIVQERMDVALRIAAIAAKDGEVQQVGISLGSRGDFNAIHGLHDQVRDIAEKAVNLLSAPQIEGREYTVVLDPILAGVFVHEAFGHLSESDFVYENDRMRDIMTLGKTFGSPVLNIVDSAAWQGLRGSFKYDDEGTPSHKTYLIREGKLVGRLHSRETAAKMGEQPTGNARAINYRHPPIVRMRDFWGQGGMQ